MTDAGEAPVEEGRRTYRQVHFELPPEATEIRLVRHGETIASDPSAPFPLVEGHGDPELAAEGRAQANLVAERLSKTRVDAIYVTTLRRTAETAAPLAALLGIEPVVEPDLREVHLGEWEGGQYRKHVMEGHPIALEMMRKERWDAIPGAESNETLRERLSAGLGRIASAHRGERVVAFTHGGAIGTIVAMATGSRPFSFVGADNGSITTIVVIGDNLAVRGFNDVCHLE